MGSKIKKFKEERGIALVIAIVLLLVITIIGVSTINTTIYDNLISGNKRISEQAFYIAEGGIHEFLGRFRADASNIIIDNAPDNVNWNLFLAIDSNKAEQIGYNQNDPNHQFFQNLQNKMDYRCHIVHKTKVVNGVEVVDYHGDNPIYIVKSFGFTSDGGEKVIEVEIQKGTSISPPSALYAKRPVDVLGSSTNIDGNDQCGLKNKPGIISRGTIDESGKPNIKGNPPYLENAELDLNINEFVNELKDFANFNYTYNSKTTLTKPPDNWGNPIQNGKGKPLSPPSDGILNIVYFDMAGNELLLNSNNMEGAGILIVDGDLSVMGGFSWYGIILVTGSLNFLGGGQQSKNVTGAILSGDRATIDLNVTVGGSTDILFCSQAIDLIKNKIPFRVKRWKEIF